MSRGFMLGASALFLIGLGIPVARATPTFVCQEPGGKRLIFISGSDVGLEADKKTLLRIDSNNDLIEDTDGHRIFFVDKDDVRPGSARAGVKIAVFDGDDIRHATGGKVLINYHHPDLCPTRQDNRIYSIEGPPISKQELVAAMYILHPDWFKLTDRKSVV